MEGFIFVSGFVFSVVRCRYANQPSELFRLSWGRAFEVAVYHIAVTVLLVLLSEFLSKFHPDWARLSQIATELGLLRTVVQILSFGLIPNYCNILPLYVVFLIAAPAVLLLIERGYMGLIVASSAVVWLVGQFWDPVGTLHGLYAATPDVFPNLISWQFIFVSALALGSRQNKLKDFSSWRGSNMIALASMLIGIILFLVKHETIPLDVSEFLSEDVKWNVGWIRLLNFSALAVVVSYLLVRTKKNTSVPFLSLLGRRSLQVFAFHIFLVNVCKPLAPYITSNYSKLTYFVFLVVCLLALLIPAALSDPYARMRLISLASRCLGRTRADSS